MYDGFGTMRLRTLVMSALASCRYGPIATKRPTTAATASIPRDTPASDRPGPELPGAAASWAGSPGRRRMRARVRRHHVRIRWDQLSDGGGATNTSDTPHLRQNRREGSFAGRDVRQTTSPGLATGTSSGVATGGCHCGADGCTGLTGATAFAAPAAFAVWPADEGATATGSVTFGVGWVSRSALDGARAIKAMARSDASFAFRSASADSARARAWASSRARRALRAVLAQFGVSHLDLSFRFGLPANLGDYGGDLRLAASSGHRSHLDHLLGTAISGLPGPSRLLGRQSLGSFGRLARPPFGLSPDPERLFLGDAGILLGLAHRRVGGGRRRERRGWVRLRRPWPAA